MNTSRESVNMKEKKEIKFKSLGSGIYEIETFYLDREQYAACYLLEDNGEIAIIETNTNYAVPCILGTLEQLGFSKSQVTYVILTHIHLDHAGGAGELMAQLPDATLVLHPRGKRHMINPEKLIASVKQVYGEAQYKELYGDILPIPAERVEAVEDGHELSVGSRQLKFLHLSGHAKHHFVVWDSTSGSLISGDNFGIGYPTMTVAGTRLLFPSTSPTQFEPEKALETYDAIVQLKPKRILLTHYGLLEDIEGGYVQLKNWIRFSVEAAQKRHAEGLREQALVDALLKDIWEHFDKEVSGARGSGLTEKEKELLAVDADINAQGLAFYINKLNA